MYQLSLLKHYYTVQVKQANLLFFFMDEQTIPCIRGKEIAVVSISDYISVGLAVICVVKDLFEMLKQKHLSDFITRLCMMSLKNKTVMARGTGQPTDFSLGQLANQFWGGTEQTFASTAGHP